MTMDDIPGRPETRRALVPQKQSRALAGGSLVQIQLARLSEGGKLIAGAIPAPLKAASRHSIRFGGGAAVIAAMLVLVAIAGLYARLLAGPFHYPSWFQPFSSSSIRSLRATASI